MKQVIKYFKFFAIYIAICIIVATVIRYFTESLEIGLFWFQLIMGTISICMIILYIWSCLKSKSAKKKFFIYTSLFIIEIILIQGISYAYGTSTRNTWLGLVGGDIIFITLGVLLFDIAKSIKEKREYVAFSLYSIVVVGTLILLLTNIFFFYKFNL